MTWHTKWISSLQRIHWIFLSLSAKIDIYKRMVYCNKLYKNKSTWIINWTWLMSKPLAATFVATNVMIQVTGNSSEKTKTVIMTDLHKLYMYKTKLKSKHIYSSKTISWHITLEHWFKENHQNQEQYHSLPHAVTAVCHQPWRALAPGNNPASSEADFFFHVYIYNCPASTEMDHMQKINCYDSKHISYYDL